jgi:CrcB protein
MTFFLEKGLTHPYLRLAITTGFIGALTTFSTFSYETVVLIEERDWFFAGMNILSNLLLGLVSVMGGIILAKAIS